MRVRIASGFLAIVTGCASTPPNYDPDARESVGRIIAKQVVAGRTQATADSFDATAVLVSVVGPVVAPIVGNALQKKTTIPIYGYTVRLVDGREVLVQSEYFASHVGDCVKLLESSRPGYPRFVSSGDCPRP